MKRLVVALSAAVLLVLSAPPALAGMHAERSPVWECFNQMRPLIGADLGPMVNPLTLEDVWAICQAFQE